MGTNDHTLMVWDTRNPLQPILLQPEAHYSNKGGIADVAYDCNEEHVNRIVSCSKLDRSVRIWNTSNTSNALTLQHEYKYHAQGVNCVDWNMHETGVVVSASDDGVLFQCHLSTAMSKHSKL